MGHCVEAASTAPHPDHLSGVARVDRQSGRLDLGAQQGRQQPPDPAHLLLGQRGDDGEQATEGHQRRSWSAMDGDRDALAGCAGINPSTERGLLVA